VRIIVNALSERRGGGQTYVRNLLARLPREGDLSVVVFAPDSLPLPDHPRLTRAQTSWPVTNPLLRAVWERFALPGILREYRADVLFCPGGLLNTRPPQGCRTATMFRNMMPFDPDAYRRLPWGLQRLRNLILRSVMLRSMKNADLTIFISRFARREVERHISVPRGLTIYHGIDRQFLVGDAPLPRPVVAGEGPYLLYVSRFEVYKHHREVVEGYASLPRHLRNQYRLLLAGETDFDAASEVRQLVERLGLADRVILTGGVPYTTLPALYQNAHAVLFASSCENCPNILLESIASGRPVLSSDVMPMPEIGGVDLLYFSPYDPADIGRKLELILSDETLAGRIGRAASARAALFNWNVTAELTWDALRAVARGDD
jgi:glycosyltransferase involved in cell wall biosynthesis